MAPLHAKISVSFTNLLVSMKEVQIFSICGDTSALEKASKQNKKYIFMKKESEVNTRTHHMPDKVNI